MTFELTPEEAWDLKFVILAEIEYLEKTAIPNANFKKDKEDLIKAKERMEAILDKFKDVKTPN